MADSESTQPDDAPNGSPAAGWYPVDRGQVRYWDGEVWTDQIAPAPSPAHGMAPTSGPAGTFVASTADDTQMAMFAHLGQLVGYFTGIGGFIVPLLIMLTRGKDSEYVRRAAVESLNFWITGFLAAIASFVLIFVLIGFFFLFLVAVIWFVMPIVAGIKANEGVDYRYPFNLRLIK